MYEGLKVKVSKREYTDAIIFFALEAKNYLIIQERK